MEDPDQIDILVPEMDPEIARASADAAEVGASIMTAATNFGDALTFLNGPDCANMTSAQKNAFLHIALGVGLTEASARYHPSQGYDPCTFINTDSIIETARLFSSPPPTPPPAPVDPVVTVQQPATTNPGHRRSTFGFPLASSTRLSTGADMATRMAPTEPPPLTDMSHALLSRIDVLETRMQNLNKGNKSSFIPDYEDSDFLIAPPKLGSKATAPVAVKALKVLVGHDRFCLDDPNCTPLRNLLPLVSQSIENASLNEASAYLCLLAILKGDINTIIGNYWSEGKPFLDAWRHLQLMGQGIYSRDQVEREIRKLVSTRPTSVSQTFSRLQILYKKLYQYIQDPYKRAAIISTSLVEDILKIISSYYPSSYPQIENLLESRRGSVNFDEVASLVEIAISYINRRHLSIGPDSSRMNPMGVEAEVKVLATAAVIPPLMPQNTFPSAPMPPQQNNTQQQL